MLFIKFWCSCLCAVNGEDDTSVTVNSQPPQVTNSPPLQESTVERQCFSTQTDMSQSYYVRGTHMLSPGSFMSYLKQPGGVMLTQLNASEAASEFASGMPDLLSAQQGKLVKQGSDLRLFKCLTCGKDFKQKSTLLQHERIHTDSRPYGCSECGKRFRQQSHLTQHLRIHANEKPFACVYCERTFRQRAILNQHLRIHSGEKPFSCVECGKRFRQKAILNQHVRTHQGEHFSPILSPCHSPINLHSSPNHDTLTDAVTQTDENSNNSKD